MRQFIYALAASIVLMWATPWATAQSGDDKADKPGAPVLSYAIASLTILIALVIVCTPSRRAVLKDEE